MENQNQKSQQALEILTTWYNQGEYQKIIDNATEILKLEPNLAAVQKILELAKDQLNAPKPQILGTLADTIQQKNPRLESDGSEEHSAKIAEYREESASRTEAIVAISVLALIAIIGGSIYWYSQKGPSLPNTEKSAAEYAKREEENLKKFQKLPVDQQTVIQNNLTRNADLQDLKSSLEIYYSTYKRYPDAEKIASELLKENIVIRIPLDPRHRQTDGDQIYGYTYTVFDTDSGQNQGFAVSAIFEGLQGKPLLSSLSNVPIPEATNPRDVSSKHSRFIEKAEITTPKVKRK